MSRKHDYSSWEGRNIAQRIQVLIGPRNPDNEEATKQLAAAVHSRVNEAGIPTQPARTAQMMPGIIFQSTDVKDMKKKMKELGVTTF